MPLHNINRKMVKHIALFIKLIFLFDLKCSPRIAGEIGDKLMTNQLPY